MYCVFQETINHHQTFNTRDILGANFALTSVWVLPDPVPCTQTPMSNTPRNKP